jgi:hypothetical protein
VLFKFLITAFATVVLLLYMETFRVMAAVAAEPAAELAVVRNASPAIHSVLAFLLLFMAAVLAVYKPLGMIRQGDAPPLWVKVFGTLAALVALLFIGLLLSRGPGGHGPARHAALSDSGTEATRSVSCFSRGQEDAPCGVLGFARHQGLFT